MIYLMTKQTRRPADEGGHDVIEHQTREVDAEHVRRYRDASSFFKNIGGLEREEYAPGGQIIVTSVSPDLSVCHTVTFTPVS